MEVITRLIQEMVNIASPEIRQLLQKLIVSLEEHAKATPNPWDNILVAILKTILGL